MVAHHFGIHNPFSAEYLQHWGNTPKELYEELEIVRKTSALIIQQLEEPSVEIGLVNGQMVEDDNSLRTSLTYGLEKRWDNLLR